MVTKMTVMMWINCPGVCIRYVYLYIIWILKSDREKKKFIEKILQSLHLLFCVCSRTLRLLRNNVTCNFPTTASARQVFNARQRSSLSAETQKKKNSLDRRGQQETAYISQLSSVLQLLFFVFKLTMPNIKSAIKQ